MLAVLKTERKMGKILNPNIQSAFYPKDADVWGPGVGIYSIDFLHF